MSTERRRRNRAGNLDGTGSEEVITYKRKRARTDAEGDGTSFSAGGEDGFTRVDFHWRNVLERLLLLPEMSKDGGIQSCIRDALTAGPFGFTRKFKMTDVPIATSLPKVYIHNYQDRCNGHCKLPDNSQGQSSSVNASTGGSASGTYIQANVHVNTMKCENILLDILLSEKFALFCDLFCGNFEDSKGKDIFNFSLINSKLRHGDYEESTELFYQDIQQVWKRFLRIGQEMALLASSLLDISLESYQKQVGKYSTDDSGELIFQGTSRSGLEQKKSEASFLYRIRGCKHCGIDADSRYSLICDECEGMYHDFCIKPAVQVNPTQSWYCAPCSSKGKTVMAKKKGENIPEPTVTNMQDSLHQNCAVCDRLEFSETQFEHTEGDKAPANDSGESTISSMESNEPPQPSRTAILRLCKKCGTAENEDKRFLICGNSSCLYKFYHIRCLKNSQVAASQWQRSQNCWYCPSCLCRGCLTDKDDSMIVMCDGCDEAYHTYCMKPPCTSVPKGNWYCIPCNVKRAWQGMRRYEQWILQQHRKKDESQTDGATGSINISSSSKKLISEEKLTDGKA